MNYEKVIVGHMSCNVFGFGLALMAGAATKVRVMWAEYDGLTPEYASNLEKALKKNIRILI